jgi:hypothetical protein
MSAHGRCAFASREIANTSERIAAVARVSKIGMIVYGSCFRCGDSQHKYVPLRMRKNWLLRTIRRKQEQLAALQQAAPALINT